MVELEETGHLWDEARAAAKDRIPQRNIVVVALYPNGDEEDKQVRLFAHAPRIKSFGLGDASGLFFANFNNFELAAKHFEYYPPPVCHDPSTEIGGVAEVPTPVNMILGRLKRSAFLLPERVGCLPPSVGPLTGNRNNI